VYRTQLKVDANGNWTSGGYRVEFPELGKIIKKKKKSVSQKKNDVTGARLFPSPLQFFFASFRFALYFY